VRRSGRNASWRSDARRAWDWNEHGTDHRPGIQAEDARELIDHGAKVVILTRGRQGALNVPEETVNAISSHGVEVRVLGTDEAIAEYNRLAETEPVGALIHSTR
jgi:hypothetical protein